MQRVKDNLLQNQSGQTALQSYDCYFSNISLRHLDLGLLKELRAKKRKLAHGLSYYCILSW